MLCVCPEITWQFACAVRHVCRSFWCERRNKKPISMIAQRFSIERNKTEFDYSKIMFFLHRSSSLFKNFVSPCILHSDRHSVVRRAQKAIAFDMRWLGIAAESEVIANACGRNCCKKHLTNALQLCILYHPKPEVSTAVQLGLQHYYYLHTDRSGSSCRMQIHFLVRTRARLVVRVHCAFSRWVAVCGVET